MLVGSAWSGHDCSYAILKNGIPVVHDEYERFIREKEPPGDGVQFLFDNYSDYKNIKALVDNMLVKEKRHIFNKKSKP